MEIKGQLKSTINVETASYLTDTGSANAYVVTYNPALTVYTDGLKISFKATNANTGASTVNVNGIGAIGLRKNVTSVLAANDILVNQIVQCTYDGTFFQIPVSSGGGGGGASGFSGYSGVGTIGTSGYSGYSGSGLSGYSGFSGISGYSGFSGLSGYSGFSGVTGIATSGFSGYSGATGAGTSGFSGYSGLSGYSGFSGVSGWSGYSGYSGTNGIIGSNGTSGFSGYSGSGLSGFSGFSGLTGAGSSGFSGFSGVSGWSGYSGFSGITGSSTSGFSGFSGVAGGGGLTWNETTATSQNMAINNGYIANNASRITFSMPSTAAIGSSLRVCGKGAGGWRIVQQIGQQIFWTAGAVDGENRTSSGASGLLDSTDQYDAIHLVCITANTTWGILSVKGNITLV